MRKQLLNLLKECEGFKGNVYICPAGYPTIGYGHVIRSGEKYPDGISQSQAERLLEKDIALATNAVARYINVPLTANQEDAIISFTFNLGAGALQRSTLRRVINREDHDQVPEELMRWVWGGGRRLPGLVKRRKAEADMYQS